MTASLAAEAEVAEDDDHNDEGTDVSTRPAVKRKTAAKKKPKRRRRAAPPPPSTMVGGLQARIASAVATAKETLAVRREAAERERRALAEVEARMRDGHDDDEEVVEMTLLERGALFGSLLMAPAGVPGLIVGGAFGGAAGYVVDRLDQARSYVTDAYGERLHVEQQNANQMAMARSELQVAPDRSPDRTSPPRLHPSP